MLRVVLAYQPETRKQHSERQDYILLCSRVAAPVVLNVHVHARFGVGSSQLSCLGILAGRALCLECSVVPWVRVPHEAAHFS